MFATIVSPNNPRVKTASSLRESRMRRKNQMFLIDGFREVIRAWHSGFEITEFFLNVGNNSVADERLDFDYAIAKSTVANERKGELAQLLRELEAKRVPVIPLSSNAFVKIGFGDRDEGVIAVVKSRFCSLDSLASILEQKNSHREEKILVGIIEGVEKPGNIGAILRSADGAGVDALIIAGDSYDVFHPNAIRSSLGTIFHLPVVIARAPDILSWTRQLNIQRATTLCDESVPYSLIDYRLPTAIVLGSEASGLTEIWAQPTEEDLTKGLLQKIRLPMMGIADSLNVSNAAAILFYEARRSRMSQ